MIYLMKVIYIKSQNLQFLLSYYYYKVKMFIKNTSILQIKTQQFESIEARSQILIYVPKIGLFMFSIAF